MIEIKRQQINDIIVPDRGVIKRPVVTPAKASSPRHIIEADRIGRNPFFQRDRRASQDTHVPEKNGRKSRGTIFSMFFALLLLAVFFIVNYFAIATIDVIPVQKSTVLGEDFYATKSETNQGLVFQFMSLEEIKSKEVPATFEQKLQRKANGKVVIYNAYSATPQRLIKNTRLESADRKIFRINDSVVVPGVTTVKGEVVPGSVEVTVFADAPGKEYNIGTTNFTIPGFKGDPRYTKFSAAITQIIILDLVFSVDSVITAVGLTNSLPVIYAAVVASFVLVLMFSSPIAKFVQKHATLKILALSFLITIGVTLVMEGLGGHVPKGYIYLPMGFALVVELLQMRFTYNQKKKKK